MTLSRAFPAARQSGTPGHERIRIAIVAASLRILGGQAVQAQRLLDGWLGDSTVDAWLVPINPVPPPPFDLLLRIKYVRTAVTQLFYWPLLVRELRRADVVHVFSASYFSFIVSPLPAIIVATALGKPVIVHYHSGEARDHLQRSPIARWTLRRVNVNVVPSAFLQDVFARFDIPATVIPNTIDLDRFVYRPRHPLAPRLLSTRNLEPMYNVACTLRAFVHVQARYPDATLTIVGDGSQATALRALAQTLGLKHVTFAGRVPPQEIHRYYDDADIYVQTPSIDNMPNSLIEAYASGLPVVATRIGGVPAILTGGVHGLLADDDDAKGVAEQIFTLVENPAYARRLAEAAHATCAAYDWSVVRDAWLTVYASLLRDARLGVPPREPVSPAEHA
jgi:glycosyltransferase involved in cell wall biosynthesis